MEDGPRHLRADREPIAPRLTRRTFFRGIAALGGLAAFDRLGIGPACSTDAVVGIDDAALDKLLPGKVLRAGAADYDRLTTPWNLRWVAQRPKARAIVRAETAEDVAKAIRWARDNGVPVVPRSGGHSYSGYSTTDGLLVDVSKMTSVAFDPSTGIATLGGGARNLDVYQNLPAVNATLTHGRCKHVGVAGLVLGGGVGFNMRRIGLTCDQLVSSVMVTAAGEILTLDATQNPDLFWAARGAGGGNFGVHTEFRIQTSTAPDLVIFNLVWTTKLEEILRALVDVLHDAPRGLGAKLSVLAKRSPSGSPTLSVSLLGQWVGTEADLRALFASVSAIAEPDTTGAGFLRTAKYWEGQEALSDEGLPEHMNERSHYCIEKLSGAALALVFERLRAWPGTSASAAWKGFVTGGAVRDVAPDATAFVHRKDWMLSTIELDWTDADSADEVARANAWVDSFHDAMAAHTSNESYQNFIDDAQKDWPRAYHGANLERLIAVKKKVDPTNFFRFAQSIPTS